MSVPAPWLWPPSSAWDGNDGLWNTFVVQVGTPPQLFRVLPSTAGQETWVVVPEGCTSTDSTDCSARCGSFNGLFVTSDSSSWQAKGLYTLDEQEAKLGYDGNGLYGLDTVALGNDSTSLKLQSQVVAGIATKSYYLGQFGLGPKPVNFSNFDNGIANYITNLVNKSYIPSLSFGYTAGAAYRNKTASLTLGGYDSGRFTSRTSFRMNEDNSRPLQVGLTKILAQNTLLGTSNLLPTSTYHFIDSTVPHIWLPNDAVQAFVAAFGLTYDNSTDLFLINNTMRTRHLQNKPTVTFVMSSNVQDNTAPSQTIVLPYAAFDLQASSPIYKNATNYFPIRIAHNDTQYTIGRTFFQEAYVIADWQRLNFSVAQTAFDGSPSLVPILTEVQLNQTAATAVNSGSSGLGSGAIAGIVVGAIVMLALCAMCFLLSWRRRRRYQSLAQQQYQDDKVLPIEESKDKPPTGVGIHEMAVEYPEVDGTTAKWSEHGVKELAGEPVGHELDARGTVLASDDRSGRHELP